MSSDHHTSPAADPPTIVIDGPANSSAAEPNIKPAPLQKRHTVTLAMSKSSEKLNNLNRRMLIRYGVYGLQGKRDAMEDAHFAVPNCPPHAVGSPSQQPAAGTGHPAPAGETLAAPAPVASPTTAPAPAPQTPAAPTADDVRRERKDKKEKKEKKKDKKKGKEKKEKKVTVVAPSDASPAAARTSPPPALLVPRLAGSDIAVLRSG